jgi:O-Antigen ligase/PDZ domain
MPNQRSADGSSTNPGHKLAVAGLFLYAIFAPHSIAAAEISLAIAATGWLVRLMTTRSNGFKRTKLDLPIFLLLLWTVASAVLSEEPRISIAKLQSVFVFLLFYLTQAIVSRRNAIVLVSVMILSGVAGSGFSVFDLARGRGVVVQSISTGSPLREAHVQPGDAIWRVGQTRVYSRQQIDEVIRQSADGKRLTVSSITRGEHTESPGFVVTPELKRLQSPSGIVGEERSHRFRASGWTRHYETFAEILQILIQLALGLAFANFQNHGANLRFKLAAAASVILAVGIGLTAMRTALVAMAIGSAVVAIRAASKGARVAVTVGIALVLAFGAVMVWNTRARNALVLNDPSSNLRLQVARTGLARIPLHPVFGHGMDAMKLHWRDWGFPGTTMIHLHSTPLQLAFDRGLPAVIFWFWIMIACWQISARAEKLTRDSGDTNAHGVLLGATGALAGFFASSMVNYNFGDGEVALLFWWLMGVVVVLAPSSSVNQRVSKTVRKEDRLNLNESRAGVNHPSQPRECKI